MGRQVDHYTSSHTMSNQQDSAHVRLLICRVSVVGKHRAWLTASPLSRGLEAGEHCTFSVFMHEQYTRHYSGPIFFIFYINIGPKP